MGQNNQGKTKKNRLIIGTTVYKKEVEENENKKVKKRTETRHANHGH